MGRLIIYGDIHGCIEEFKALRKRLNPSCHDTEVIAGDLVNKGPASHAVIEYARTHQIKAILGNHEERFLRYHRYEMMHRERGIKNPMAMNKEERNIYKSFSNNDLEYLESLPFYLKFDHITIVHGGLSNHYKLKNLDRHRREKILRMRYVDRDHHFVSVDASPKKHLFWSECYNGKEGFIVYGHTPFETPRYDEYALGIDTGCVYGGALSAVVFNDPKVIAFEVVSQPAFQTYTQSSRFKKSAS